MPVIVNGKSVPAPAIRNTGVTIGLQVSGVFPSTVLWTETRRVPVCCKYSYTVWPYACIYVRVHVDLGRVAVLQPV